MEAIKTGLDTVLQQFFEWGPRVLLGLVLLFVGWIVAKILQTTIILASKKLGVDKPFETAQAGAVSAVPESKRPSSIIGISTFWVVMMFVLIGFFSAMNLSMVAQPLQAMLNKVSSGIPNLIGALFLLGIGWLVASLLRSGVSKALGKIEADQKLKKFGLLNEEMAEKKRFSQVVGLLTYGLVLLVFAQSALELIGLKLVASTAQGLVDSAVGVMPHIMSAALVFFVALLIASLIRPMVSGFLETAGIDKHSHHFGIEDSDEEKKPKSLSQLFGNVVFWLILLFAFPAVLDQLQLTAVVEPLRGVWDKVFAALPNLGAALLMILGVYFGFKIFAPIFKGLLENIGVDNLLGKVGLTNLQDKFDGDEVKLSPSEVVVRTVMLVISLMVTQEILHVLNLTYLADMVQSIVNFLPNVLVAVIIIGVALRVGSLLGDLAEGAASGLDKATATTLKAMTKIAVFFFGGSLALTQLGIGGSVVEGTTIVLAGGIALAFAISVGLGAKPAVEKFIDSRLNTESK